jgi:peroxin-3
MYTNRHDRRRRRRAPHPSPFSTAATVATAAALAYGAYKLGSHLWNSYQGNSDGESEEEEDEYKCENSRGRDINGTEPRSNYRSRRSRGDWSETNHRRRSHRPSPGEGYVHHNVGYEFRSSGVTSISEDDERPTVSPVVRNARMQRCRTETSRAMMDFLPTLKKAVAKQTDVTCETEELKRLRVAKREGNVGEKDRVRERKLWNDIKNKSVTRLVTTVYAHTIVLLVLTVQVNLLGGRLLREEGGDGEAAETESFDKYRASHQLVLSKTYDHIFSKGIPYLVEVVSKVVESVVQDWDVLGSVNNGTDMKDTVSIRDISSWIEQVRDEVEQRSQKGVSLTTVLAPFIIPDESENNQDGSGGDEITDELARYILDETYDLLESPSFANSERACLDSTFSHLQNNGYGKLFAPRNDEDVPLAAAITHLQKTVVSTFYKPPSKKDEIESWGGVFGMMEEPLPSDANVYIPILERLDAVLELGNVCFD